MSSSNAIAKGEAFPDTGPIRVMVVDDSAVIRGLVRQWLDQDPDIRVVHTAPNGRSAVSNLLSSGAEVVILLLKGDVEADSDFIKECDRALDGF